MHRELVVILADLLERQPAKGERVRVPRDAAVHDSVPDEPHPLGTGGEADATPVVALFLPVLGELMAEPLWHALEKAPVLARHRLVAGGGMVLSNLQQGVGAREQRIARAVTDAVQVQEVISS